MTDGMRAIRFLCVSGEWFKDIGTSRSLYLSADSATGRGMRQAPKGDLSVTLSRSSMTGHTHYPAIRPLYKVVRWVS
ncbi:hypothetical protein GCM10009780_18180 [Actinomadura alba]